MADYDVIIIGGNTPSLVTASYLARDAGLKVAILERSDFIGATAMTIEMTPGYKFSPAATGEFNAHPKILHDLELEKYGLQEITCDPFLTTAFGDGRYLSLCNSVDQTCENIAKFSEHDAEAYRTFIKEWMAVGTMFGLEQMSEPPPMGQFVSAMSSSPAMERMCRNMLFGTCEDILDNTFENEYVKAAFLTLNEGNQAGPHNGTFFFNLGRILHPWGFIKGGLVKVAEALEQAAKSFGVEIIRNAEVTKIIVENGEAKGVETADGQRYSAGVAVISELELPYTFDELVGDQVILPADFERGLREIKFECAGVTLNLALDKLPNFGFPKECYNGFFGITKPGYKYAEKAFAEFTLGKIPERLLSMSYIPTYYEEPGTFAPEGHHVLTGYAFPVPGRRLEGEWDDAMKQKLIDTWITSLDEFAPGLRESVIYADGYTPKELDEMFLMTDGDLGHGTMRWYSEMSYRPIPGWSKYRSPVKSLYMAGMNVHPLSGVGGVAGYVVSRAVLDDHANIKADRTADTNHEDFAGGRW